MVIRGLLTFLVALLSTVALAGGDVEAGKAMAITCGACHGQDGNTGLMPTYPGIGGQKESYLFRQLTLIQSGARAAPLMAGQLTGKSEEDLRNLAAYYSSLAPKQGEAAGTDEAIAQAQGIYRGGIMGKRVAACTACHSPTGNGNELAGFPRIAGQSPEYTILQLTAYREGQRVTDEDFGDMMQDVAAGLTDTEIKNLADYLQGLH
jgi:cytochrome c553